MNGPDWLENTDFQSIDARELEGFFLAKIIQASKALPKGRGMKVIQNFEPLSLYGVMEKEGWQHFTEKISDTEYHIYFARSKKAQTKEKTAAPAGKEKIPVVIQSATPVVYPVILRLLQSPKLQTVMEVKKLKVWKKQKSIWDGL